MKRINKIKKLSLSTVILMLGVISVSCHADVNKNSKTYQFLEIQDCSQSSTQSAMDSCREKAYKIVSSKLSLVTEKISKNYSINEPKLEPVFKVAQQKWNGFISAECEFSSYYSRGGIGYNGYFLGCLELKTLKRIRYLKNVLETP